MEQSQRKFSHFFSSVWRKAACKRRFLRDIVAGRYFSVMKDLVNPRLIKLKGILFLLIGVVAAVLLVLDQPDLKTAALLAIAIWCSCRFYYFAFYVIKHYVDPGYRFSGLWSFARYMARKRRQDK
jgi:hypothetical protein